MAAAQLATWMLEREARAMLARLDRVKPFAVQETMLPAAALSPAAQTGIEQYLLRGRRTLRRRWAEYVVVVVFIAALVVALLLLTDVLETTAAKGDKPGAAETNP